MSKKRGAVGPYSYDDDDDYVPTKAVNYSVQDEQPGPAKKKAHTLDSDEEDGEDAGEDASDLAGEENAHAVLNEEDIEGQEEKTVDFEGETTITPFNMKEELEEGHFDGDGFYHFKKDSEQVKDAWLDDIDWIKVKHSEENKNKYGSDEDDDDSGDVPDAAATAAILATEKEDQLTAYKQMLDLVQPGETVTKALKRLGGGRRLTSSQKWHLKKQSAGSGEKADQSTEQLRNMERMLELTQLANKVVEAGNMDVYEETYEVISLKVRPPEPDSPAMDMFTDAPAAASSTTAASSASAAASTDDNKNGSSTAGVGEQELTEIADEVRWQLKWENKEEAEVHGPFPSSQMVKWQDSGYLDKGAYVRKVSDKEGSWYHTKRIDFEIYV